MKQYFMLSLYRASYSAVAELCNHNEFLLHRKEQAIYMDIFIVCDIFITCKTVLPWRGNAGPRWQWSIYTFEYKCSWSGKKKRFSVCPVCKTGPKYIKTLCNLINWSVRKCSRFICHTGNKGSGRTQCIALSFFVLYSVDKLGYWKRRSPKNNNLAKSTSKLVRLVCLSNTISSLIPAQWAGKGNTFPPIHLATI